MTPCKVVFIDDCPKGQLYMKRLIKRFEGKADLTLHDNGKEGLLWLKRQIDLPALVFVNLTLPDMSGINLIQEVKALPRFKVVPFVMISDLSDPELLLKGYEVGAVSHAISPYTKLGALGWGKEYKFALHYWLSRNPVKLCS